MALASAGFTQFHFTTARVPPRERIAQWYEMFDRAVSRRQLSLTGGGDCHVDLTITNMPYGETGSTVPGVGIQRMRLTGGLKAQRTRELLGDNDPDLVLHIQQSGRHEVSQHGRHAVARAGEGLLTSNAEVSTCFVAEPNRFVSIKLPRAIMTAMVPTVEDAVGRRLPDPTGSFRLLLRYLHAIRDGAALPTPELRRAAANHIQDLCVLALGARRDAAEFAQYRSIRAARLATLKADIHQNLTDEALSAPVLARRHGITPRYVHKLFEGDGTTLSRFVLGLRLVQVHRLLCDPRYADSGIGALAYSAGFSDLSTFNREFRRRFAATPSDVRAAGSLTPASAARPPRR